MIHFIYHFIILFFYCEVAKTFWSAFCLWLANLKIVIEPMTLLDISVWCIQEGERLQSTESSHISKFLLGCHYGKHSRDLCFICFFFNFFHFYFFFRVGKSLACHSPANLFIYLFIYLLQFNGIFTTTTKKNSNKREKKRP